MSGPQLDIDAIDPRTEQITTLAALLRSINGAHDMGAGALAEALYGRGVRVGAAVTPTPQETCEHGKTRPHFTSRELTAETYAYDCPGPVTSTPEAATEAPLVDCYEPCAACHGSGLANGINDVVSCYDCKGDGLVRRRDERGRFISASSNGDWTIADWEDWSNDLASLLPERYDNDVAQESLILDAVRDLVERDAASGLQRATEQQQ